MDTSWEARSADTPKPSAAILFQTRNVPRRNQYSMKRDVTEQSWLYRIGDIHRVCAALARRQFPNSTKGRDNVGRYTVISRGNLSEAEMTSERLRQIEALYRAAREDRGVLTDAGPELRLEVEWLLAPRVPHWPLWPPARCSLGMSSRRRRLHRPTSRPVCDRRALRRGRHGRGLPASPPAGGFSAMRTWHPR
jgi:hypothetical protein